MIFNLKNKPQLHTFSLNKSCKIEKNTKQNLETSYQMNFTYESCAKKVFRCHKNVWQWCKIKRASPENVGNGVAIM